MNSKLGQVLIFDDGNDFPKGIRFIFIIHKNMTYKKMPFYDKCCSLDISFFSNLSHEGKIKYLNLILLRDCSYYY